jgi:hypothetical protein
VDASVGIKVCITEEFSDRADAVPDSPARWLGDWNP